MASIMLQEQDLGLTFRGSGENFQGNCRQAPWNRRWGYALGPSATRVRRPIYTTKREILRSVLRFFLLKCGSTYHFQVGLRVLCDCQTLNTERTEHRRDLSVEALKARRPQRTSGPIQVTRRSI